MIPAIGPAVVAVTAALTLKSDTRPVRVAVNKPRGTVYWGGAGLNGAYVQDQVEAFREAGITHVWIGKRSLGETHDALRSATSLRYEGDPLDQSWMVEGMESVPAEQFNLIGYSYGSLMAAHTAHVYAANGHIVDHLVLIGSPIDRDFLSSLSANQNIRKLIIMDLTRHGDPVHAGIGQLALIFSKSTLEKQLAQSGTTRGIGHFYYKPDSEEGRLRRRQLARQLYREGLR